MKKFYLESLGCAKNLVDSERFASILVEAGYKLSFDVEEAEIVFINTCAFLQSALDELDEVLETVVRLKSDKTIGQIIVSGCVMNREADKLKKAYPMVDYWIGLKDFDALASILKSPDNKQSIHLENGFHAYLRISDGCENYCSYCKIPSIRGSLKSVPIEQLVVQARLLAKRPVISKIRPSSNKPAFPKELVLIAQDTCLYGTDIYGKPSLPELIAALHEIEGFEWIRLLYLHPDHFDLAWLELWAKYPKLLPYFEIPIQHISNSILTAMNRVKCEAELKTLFNTIIKKIPNAALRTTLMVGFPGETTREVDKLLSLIKNIPFLHMGSFVFSPEDGTPAFTMPNQVRDTIAENRQFKLDIAWHKQQEQRWHSFVGKSIQAIVESQVVGKSLEYNCRAWFQAPDIDGCLVLSRCETKLGSIVNVVIDDVIGNILFGHIDPRGKEND